MPNPSEEERKRPLLALGQPTVINVKTGAANNRGGSEQVVSTPPELVLAIEGRFGHLDYDLAATPENAVCSFYYTETDDSLKITWPSGQHWLNPPFKEIGKWVAKAYFETQCNPNCRVIMLVPASVSTNWYRDYVDGKAICIPIKRPKFVGQKNVIAKDMMLVIYGGGLSGWQSPWDWTGGK